MTKKETNLQLQIISELLVNLSSGFFGYIFLLSFTDLNIGLLIRSVIFGFAFYYFAVKIRSGV